MRYRPLSVLLAISLVAGCTSDARADERAHIDQRVSAALILKGPEYDPKQPSDSVLKCVVRNESLQPIVVPVGNDGKDVELHSRQLILVRRRLRSGKAEPGKDDLSVKMVQVDPGQEKVIFLESGSFVATPLDKAVVSH